MPKIGAPIEPSRVDGVEAWWRTISALERRRPAVKEDDDSTEALVAIGDPID